MVSGICRYCGQTTSEIMIKRNLFCSYKHYLLYNPGAKLRVGFAILIIGMGLYFVLPIISHNIQPIGWIFITSGIGLIIIAWIGFIVRRPKTLPAILETHVERGNQQNEKLPDDYIIQPRRIIQRISQLLVFGWLLVDVFFSIFIGRLIIAATLIGVFVFPLVGRNFTNKLMIHPNHFILKGTFGAKGYYYRTLGRYSTARIKYNTLGKPVYIISAEFIDETNQSHRIRFSSALPVHEVIKFLETYNQRYLDAGDKYSNTDESTNLIQDKNTANTINSGRVCKACGKDDKIGKNYCPNCGSKFL